ncbi:MAG TPA: exo-beta-N-acetylmuramidase NamZ domain-containing protein [Tepidisphaeraceae bacterium]|nr:exo-beta-N-acetylmuramidase NamZ domain-containing protein [Tepidisphaeraceae bacterium]
MNSGNPELQHSVKIGVGACRLGLFLTLALAFVSGCARSTHTQTALPATPPDPQLLAQADDAINESIQRGQIPGAVLVVGRGDGIVYRKAYGQRSLQPAQVPMTPDTIFDLASLSKPVGCATSIMMLADRGKLKLSDPVGKYLPPFACNGKEAITIEQLLLHQGGLVPDNPMSDYQSDPATALQCIYASSPRRAPGSAFWYSDVGYIVLGQVVRAVDGRSLDQFAREEIFQPLAMRDSGYKPSPDLQSRCAPTEMRDGHWMVGEVHDPRAYALGGVAGHAGVFSTADDLARFCRMILHAGQLDGHRILSEQAIHDMTQPRSLPDGTGCRTYGFDVDTPYSSTRGDRFERGTTFGHTGFTGTMLWIDPKNKCFVVFLTSRVHPNGKGEVGRLRQRVATLVAEALLGPTPLLAGPSVAAALKDAQTLQADRTAQAEVLCGIDVLERDGFKLLAGRRIALITNHTGRDRQGRRTLDLLRAADNVKLVKLLSPEHGLYGALDEKIGNTVEPKTGLPVFSLYGQTVKPTPEMLEGVDTLVFDIQDVGARFYTYISTLGHCMEAAAKNKLKMVVLDRPNPITGLIVDGPIADRFSFTAYGPLPVAHGMTIGELARLYNDEFNIDCDLTVVPLQGWSRSMWFDQTQLTWVNPSPNMRNLTQATLYPGVCLLESSNISVGRGTDQPFELLGAPWIDGRKLAAALNSANLPGLRFVPIEFVPKSSKFANQTCQGVFILLTDRNAVEPVRAGLAIAWHLKHLFGDAFQFEKVGNLLANQETLQSLNKCETPTTLPTQWQSPLEGFRYMRTRYLLYP